MKSTDFVKKFCCLSLWTMPLPARKPLERQLEAFLLIFFFSFREHSKYPFHIPFCLKKYIFSYLSHLPDEGYACCKPWKSESLN